MDVPLPIFRLLGRNRARVHFSVGKAGGNCTGNESGLFVGRHDELVTHVVCSRLGVDSGSVGSVGSIPSPRGRRDMFSVFCFLLLFFQSGFSNGLICLLPHPPPPHPHSPIRCLPPPTPLYPPAVPKRSKMAGAAAC